MYSECTVKTIQNVKCPFIYSTNTIVAAHIWKKLTKITENNPQLSTTFSRIVVWNISSLYFSTASAQFEYFLMSLSLPTDDWISSKQLFFFIHWQNSSLMLCTLPRKKLNSWSKHWRHISKVVIIFLRVFVPLPFALDVWFGMHHLYGY